MLVSKTGSLISLLLAVLALAILTTVPTVKAQEAHQTPEQRRLFVEGAKLWPVYCAQCHNARPGSQFSPEQWQTITMHMRTQSIMPAKNIRAIREFLQEAR
ncbi:MAG TPA: cytochrome c [Blastocatellia bacterium]|nr:cytochrome c [Blastocatellia bacterium]